MNAIQVYLWVCCAAVVGISVMLGLAVLLGGAGHKGGARYSPWPLVTAVTAVCLCVQIGYVAAPLAVQAGGDWWRWALVGMAPLSLLSLCAVAGNLLRVVRQRVKGQAVRVRPGLATALVLQGAVYVGAPLAVWLARTPVGS